MRRNVKLFVKMVSEILDLEEPIYEFGSLQLPGQEGFADLRPIFQGKTYVGCDIVRGVGVDRIENVMRISLGDETVGSVILVETLEHVENPFKALNEIYRILKSTGTVVMTSVMDYPIHNAPKGYCRAGLLDYWRFTPQAFTLLLIKFPIKIIGFQGNPVYPHTVFGVGIRSKTVNEIIAKYETLKTRFSKELPKVDASWQRKILHHLGLICKIPLFGHYFAKIFRYVGYYQINFILIRDRVNEGSTNNTRKRF